MTGSTLRLDSADLLRALASIDLVASLADELVSCGGVEPYRVVPGGRNADTAIEHLGSGTTCVMPTETLLMIKATGLTALAARELVMPGAVTAAVFCANTMLPQVTLLARYVPTLTQVTVFAARVEPVVLVDTLSPAERDLLGQLDRAGIDLSTAPDPKDAAFGANLLVFADPTTDCPDIGVPAPGVVVVNASGRDLPPGLLARVDIVVVDDLRLLGAHRHRGFVRQHDAGLRAAEPPPAAREGWHRRWAGWRRRRRVDADLLDVLAGAWSRRAPEDIVLVELLGVREVDVPLAGRLRQSALRSGLGRWIDPA